MSARANKTPADSGTKAWACASPLYSWGLTMRALLLGLVGLVAVVGGAEAKTCPLDGLQLQAQARGTPANASLNGSRFTVVRQASSFRTGPDFSKGAVTTRGRIAVEIRGESGSYIVAQDYDPSASPWVSAESWPLAGAPANMGWGKRARRDERRLFEKDGSFDVYGGPLSGLSLLPLNCRD